jgi:hypothetical protein
MSKTSFDSGYAQLEPLKMYCEIHGPGAAEVRTRAAAMAGIPRCRSLIIVPGTHGSYLGEAGSTAGRMAEVTVTLVKEFLDK